ncbi:MAG: hypothetical protein ACKPJJ_08565, partial [Planctomycetaceae bacterium]
MYAGGLAIDRSTIEFAADFGLNGGLRAFENGHGATADVEPYRTAVLEVGWQGDECGGGLEFRAFGHFELNLTGPVPDAKLEQILLSATG